MAVDTLVLPGWQEPEPLGAGPSEVDVSAPRPDRKIRSWPGRAIRSRWLAWGLAVLVLASGSTVALLQQDRLDKTRTTLATTTSNLRTANSRISTLEGEASDMRTKIDDLNSRISTQRGQINSLQGEINGLHASNSKLASSLAICRKALGEVADLENLATRSNGYLGNAIEAALIGDYLGASSWLDQASGISAQFNTLLAVANADFGTCQNDLGV